MYGSLFRSQAQLYRLFRPVYPAEVLAQLLRFHGHRPTHLAVDIATGSGQLAAQLLAQEFTRVIGTDVSEEQLQHAAQAPNVEYRVATAERTGLPDKSVDVVTCAQAMHWFDIPAFYREAHRILKPEGTLAVIGYDLCTVESAGGSEEKTPNERFEDASQLIRQLYNGTLDGYWADRRTLLDRRYHGVEHPEELYSDFVRHEMPMTKNMPIKAFIGYLSSWSGYVTYRKQNPEAADPLEELQQQMLRVLDKAEDDEIAVSWPLFLLLGRAK